MVFSHYSFPSGRILTAYTLGTYHLPQRCSRWDRVRFHCSSIALPRSGFSRKTHKPLHKYTWRLCYGRVGNLRHNDLHFVSCHYHLCGSSGVHGLFTPVRRCTRQALLFAAFKCYGSSAKRRVFWAGERYCDPRKGNLEGSGTAEWDLPEAFDATT